MTYPPSGPPQPPPPWGNYPAPASQPPPSGQGWKILCGAAIGFLSTIVLPFASLGLAQRAGFGIVVVPLALVPVVGTGLLLAPTTRPWGAGMLIGWAVSLVVAAGACVALLSGLS
jgi:hypothetical protein